MNQDSLLINMTSFILKGSPGRCKYHLPHQKNCHIRMVDGALKDNNEQSSFRPVQRGFMWVQRPQLHQIPDKDKLQFEEEDRR